MTLAQKLGQAVQPRHARMLAAGFGLASVPIAAYAASRARPGEALAEGISTAAAINVESAALFSAAILPALGVPGAVAVPAIAALAIYPALGTRKMVHRAVKTFSAIDRQVRRLEMGGDYSDTDVARSLRMAAILDMHRTAAPRRQWLGNEAAILHG